jgi:hypothetical protein
MLLTLNDLLEIEDNYQPVTSVKVRKFRDQPKQKQTKPIHNNYRIVPNEILD